MTFANIIKGKVVVRTVAVVRCVNITKEEVNAKTVVVVKFANIIN